jgi:hypothetical protein
MPKVNIFALVTALVAIALIAVPTLASAQRAGAKEGVYCKSGKHVKNAKSCKENGGTN